MTQTSRGSAALRGSRRATPLRVRQAQGRCPAAIGGAQRSRGIVNMGVHASTSPSEAFMRRRDFLRAAALTASAPLLLPNPFGQALAGNRDLITDAPQVDDHFTQILAGYLQNLERTTPNSF